MSDLHSILLETYFFECVDQGTRPDDTPLLVGIYRGESLCELVAREFDIPEWEAETAIEAAREEVSL